MQARLPILTGALLAAVLAAQPAGATQRCGNVLADGRVIVQGPLVTTLGQFCSVAVVRGSTGLTVIDRAHFAGNLVILTPPFAVAPPRVVIVEQPFVGVARGSTVLLRTPPGIAAVPTMRFTTGPIGPLTTFSNSQPRAGTTLVTPGTIVVTRPTGITGITGAHR